MSSVDTSSRSGRVQRKEETRARIIEATITSVGARGAAGASVGAIMKEAGISRGLVGYHFGNRANLLAAAFQRLGDDYRALLGIAHGQERGLPADAERRLYAVIRRCFEWPGGYQNRQYAWFGFWALARTVAELRSVNKEINDEVADYLGGLLGAAAARRGRTIDEQMAGRELSATIDGAWLHLTTGVMSFTADEAVSMCEQCTQHLLEQEWGSATSRE